LYINPITNLVNYFYFYNLNKLTKISKLQNVTNSLENFKNKNLFVKEVKQSITNLSISDKITLLNKIIKLIQYTSFSLNKNLILSNRLM